MTTRAEAPGAATQLVAQTYRKARTPCAVPRWWWRRECFPPTTACLGPRLHSAQLAHTVHGLRGRRHRCTSLNVRGGALGTPTTTVRTFAGLRTSVTSSTSASAARRFSSSDEIIQHIPHLNPAAASRDTARCQPAKPGVRERYHAPMAMCTCTSHMDRTKHPGSQICLLHNAPLRDDDGAAALSVHLCNLEEATAGVLAHVEVQALSLHHKGARVDLALAPYITART